MSETLLSIARNQIETGEGRPRRFPELPPPRGGTAAQRERLSTFR
jgi:hypothetical protein